MATLKRYEEVPIESLVLDPANARLHPQKNLDAIKGSIARWGQERPILVSRKTRVIIAGNGTMRAMRELGYDKIEVKWTDLDGPEAIAYALADNRTAELAEWDMPVLGPQLTALQDSGIDIGEFGFSMDDFQFQSPDYGALDGAPDPDYDGMRAGVRKAIQVEFDLEHYEEAKALFKFWRDEGGDIGMMVLNHLRDQKERLS